MKFSRLTLAATLSTALVLSACTGGDPAEDSAPDATTTAPAGTDGATATATGSPGDADAATATAQDGAATAGPGEDADDAQETETVAMSTDEVAAAISLEEAEEAALTVLTTRYEADQGDGADITDLQRMSLMGSARQAHEAADRLESVLGEPAAWDPEETPLEPNVLAISRDDGEAPMFLLVQTVPEGGLPVLHLLESRTLETKDFRIIWEAPMLPGTEVPSFDRRSEGSPVLRSGQGELTMEPRDLLKSVAAYTSYPQPEEIPDYRTHGYAPAVRSAAQAQAEAVEGQARLRERNWLVSADTKTLLFEDGSALVMGTMLRDTTFTVDAGSELTPPETFRAFQDTATLTEEAVLRTMVFVGMRAPSETVDFKPEMIAAREQLVDAWGS